MLNEQWPQLRRPNQSVYVIRLIGEVAVAYKETFSPVIYIGRGNAFSRLYNHTIWPAPLVIAVPQLRISIRIVETARRNHSTLYQHIEADLLRWFCNEAGAVPWFNRRRESSKEDQYDYELEAEGKLKKLIGKGSGNKYQWAIRPTENNRHFTPYAKGFTSKD